MIQESHYNHILFRQLEPYVLNENYEGLTAWLDGLSNANFRTVGYMLGERVAVQLPVESFWALVSSLVYYDSKAFLVTMAKSLVSRIRAGEVSVYDSSFVSFCSSLNAIERQKLLRLLLPEVAETSDIVQLLHVTNVTDPRDRISYLMSVSNIPAYFVLFQSLKYVDHDRSLLVKIAHFLIKKNEPLAFNLASLIKVYFGLEEVKGTFSLNIAPFQLSRLDTSFEAFSQAMKLS